MATSTLKPGRVEADEQAMVLHAIDWKTYVTIADALVDRHSPRMVYVDESLTFE